VANNSNSKNCCNNKLQNGSCNLRLAAKDEDGIHGNNAFIVAVNMNHRKEQKLQPQ